MIKLGYYSKIAALLLAVFITACSNGRLQTEVESITIDNANAFLPVVKVKINNGQKEIAKPKAEWETISGLFIVTDSGTSPYAVSCKYTLKGDTLYFTPLQSLGSDMQFVVQAYNGSDTIIERLSTPQYTNSYIKPAVENIFPLAEAIPENILMFHVRFETSMVEDPEAFEQIVLLDEDGKEKELVWREKSNWTDEGRHLVLMIHPGRIKRDIEYMEEYGKLFEKGKKYTLVVPAQMLDKFGNQLGKEYRKNFYVKQTDRDIPVFLTTQFHAPERETKTALQLKFSEAIDYGTSQIGIEIRNSSDEKVAGKIEVETDDKFQFVPDNKWEKGKYKVVLNDYLTDLASNHFTRKFEVLHIDSISNSKPIVFEFKVK